ncbi:hypothetical protein CMV_006823 [Castanea mollissima]|uniref:Uncharacterized protein n=1 Tax=Castanea mollissima TaxID=60419 RepID=A0A8J4RNE6_9ROSI|nr:hypothetical protein CMV_006823 [Castanea mollissima]
MVAIPVIVFKTKRKTAPIKADLDELHAPNFHTSTTNLPLHFPKPTVASSFVKPRLPNFGNGRKCRP